MRPAMVPFTRVCSWRPMWWRRPFTVPPWRGPCSKSWGTPYPPVQKTGAATSSREEALVRFCQAIQYASPVDSYVTPEPWAMPGYQDKVIMAAGTFVAGASIELSADAPIRPPYIGYLQGGLSYTHVRLALQEAVERIMRT